MSPKSPFEELFGIPVPDRKYSSLAEALAGIKLPSALARSPLIQTFAPPPGPVSSLMPLPSLTEALAGIQLPSSPVRSPLVPAFPPPRRSTGSLLPPPTETPTFGQEYFARMASALLRKSPEVNAGRVLPTLDDLAIMEGREIRAAFVYTDLDAFTKIVATQKAANSFALLQTVVRLVSLITGHYSGAVVDCAGDRILSVFYRPASDLSSGPVAEAVTAAFWIQTMMQSAIAPVFAQRGIRANVGIGIDYGAVVAGCVGIRGGKRFIFLGDAANNAAKLQDAAGPGETLLSLEVYRRKPTYMNTWQVTQERNSSGGYLYRVNLYFAEAAKPPKCT